jgi:hypothetical protein
MTADCLQRNLDDVSKKNPPHMAVLANFLHMW